MQPVSMTQSGLTRKKKKKQKEKHPRKTKEESLNQQTKALNSLKLVVQKRV